MYNVRVCICACARVHTLCVCLSSPVFLPLHRFIFQRIRDLFCCRSNYTLLYIQGYIYNRLIYLVLYRLYTGIVHRALHMCMYIVLLHIYIHTYRYSIYIFIYTQYTTKNTCTMYYVPCTRYLVHVPCTVHSTFYISLITYTYVHST